MANATDTLVALDEAFFCRVPYSPDWITANYMQDRDSYWTRTGNVIFELGIYYHYGYGQPQWELLSFRCEHAHWRDVRMEAHAIDHPDSLRGRLARQYFDWYFMEAVL